MPEPAIVCYPNGAFAQNCYVLADEATGGSVMVDPGEEWERILADVKRRGWRIEAIWLTHAHIDHVLGVAGVKAATGAPIHLHPSERVVYDSIPAQGQWMGIDVEPLPPPDHDLLEGSELRLGPHRLTVRATPGHTPGSVSLVGDGYVLTGDALFAGSIGRTDLPGGNHEQLISRIRTELLTLPDEFRVLSGHGPETTIGRERISNPWLT